MIDGTLLLSPVIFLSVSQFHVFLPWVNSCLSYILEYESCLQQGECPGRGLVFFKLREGSLAALQQNNLTWGGRQVLSAAARRLLLLLLGCFAAVREAEQKTRNDEWSLVQEGGGEGAYSYFTIYNSARTELLLQEKTHISLFVSRPRLLSPQIQTQYTH